ncbi:hypothetical protein Isop_3507 [Isosphaera pallida ATCC 43644]|uniref:Radical SAM domain protein n=1 Tax=Isosphaera pallida (strain ATCC 43644 / DSM 9630 / IS1B) TaxID=575540 RepID=E8QX25_ISOPI|nr:arsenosugar biosynthesis radical SAM (seleno)protein ArsS [Isosphaera pallida]ADV64064.1 hypothetical protein Isop_3507 [Isosphaera pallida ATCC 43644]
MTNPLPPPNLVRLESPAGFTTSGRHPSPRLSLARRAAPLASPQEQIHLLNHTAAPEFAEVLKARGLPPLKASGVAVLQLNLGKLCNQTCSHCHVDAGPDRREVMSRAHLEYALEILKRTEIGTVDLTGGAPEMNPHFRWFVAEARSLGRRVINRCNLTILNAPGFTDLPEFLAAHQVEIVASLPCYLEENTDRQRGDGVFVRSIAALKRLNALGYGQPAERGGLPLTLVYNPIGPTLPPSQNALETDYRRQLSERFGIVFTRLFTITNLPISRFLEELVREDQLDTYMSLLVNSFNPATVEGVMCRETVSVSWDGRLFDCDFNQMLDLETDSAVPRRLDEFDAEALGSRRIVTGKHCFGCTAGAGSSCQGALV